MKRMSKSINIFLWVLQILFALYFIAGGLYMAFNYKILANVWAVKMLPQPVWHALGLIEVIFGSGLVLPGIVRKWYKLIPISAICLMVISILGSVLYVAYAGSGILWAVIPAMILAYVAYGRRM